MTRITARIPLVDWGQGFDRHWNAGNPGVTHAFNSLSFLFPQAEKFFVDVVHEAIQNIDLTKNLELSNAIQGFISQESTHSHQHTHYNKILEGQGFENVVHDFIQRLQKSSKRTHSTTTKLAIVAAYEHYTAVLGNYLLCNPHVIERAQPPMALIWGWHSAEETEHKSVCFDLYREVGGGWLRRILIFGLVTFNFSLMFGRLYFSLLWRDGCWKAGQFLRTVRQVLSLFFGTTGVGWFILRDGLRYLSPTFHPWDQNNRDKLDSWLIINKSKLRQINDKR